MFLPALLNDHSVCAPYAFFRKFCKCAALVLVATHRAPFFDALQLSWLRLIGRLQ
jgi:hypothetical protein